MQFEAVTVKKSVSRHLGYYFGGQGASGEELTCIQTTGQIWTLNEKPEYTNGKKKLSFAVRIKGQA